ncbi:MAG: thiamine phosphate synthase [Deltaproteobacteria bacterium]|nr:thiamine phosphate synthase [Deltaproteobacteria bacterium]
MNSKVYRIIDANINRVTEGLRVVEDIFRYYYDNKTFQKQLKALRHRVITNASQDRFISYRNASSDVGFAAIGELEFNRASIQDVIRSNTKRVQEGLRVLEEVFKIEYPHIAQKMKQVRYDVYQIEKDIHKFRAKLVLNKGLYLILTDPSTLGGYEEMAKLAVKAELPAIQLRYKGDNDKEFLRYAFQIRQITSGTNTAFIVNDRADIALISNADGLHLGQNDIPPEKARGLLGEDCLIGLSTHNLEQVKSAQGLPIDYIGFGPIWATVSKVKADPATGIEALRSCVEMSKFPVVAIGGIDRKRLKDLSGISYNNIAVLSAIRDAKDTYKEMLDLNKKTLEQS